MSLLSNLAHNHERQTSHTNGSMPNHIKRILYNDPIEKGINKADNSIRPICIGHTITKLAVRLLIVVFIDQEGKEEKASDQRPFVGNASQSFKYHYHVGLDANFHRWWTLIIVGHSARGVVTFVVEEGKGRLTDVVCRIADVGCAPYGRRLLHCGHHLLH